MHALAKLGQLSLRTLAPKQVAAELVFEVPNGASERRLRHIAPFGSSGEIQLTGRRQEISDLLHFHSCSLPLNCERSVRRVSGRRLPSSVIATWLTNARHAPCDRLFRLNSGLRRGQRDVRLVQGNVWRAFPRLPRAPSSCAQSQHCAPCLRGTSRVNERCMEIEEI